jgi:alpha/beta superfamily hydrolase
MKTSLSFVLILAAATARAADPAPAPVAAASAPAPVAATTLAEARRGFVTTLMGRGEPAGPPEVPPKGILSLVKYPAPPGELSAYVTPDRGDGVKRPAILWITGGDCNSIGDVWSEAPRSNDQTASAFRKAGIVMMYPSLRGGNDSPGRREGFLGEVDDVLAAADWLAKRADVDPERVYLGGHSTGGTLAMLVAETSPRFRGVIALGPGAEAAGYGSDYVFADLSDAQEMRLRSPGAWLASVQSPLLVIEGATGRGNVEELELMRDASTNPLVTFVAVRGRDHFSVIAPVTELLAKKIVAGEPLAIGAAELASLSP